MSQLAKNLRNIEPNLIDWAFRYDAFKQKLLTDSRVLIQEEFGIKLPTDLKIEVLEETENNFYMILPQNPYEEFSSEKQLIDLLGVTFLDVAYWVLEQRQVSSFINNKGAKDFEAQLIKLIAQSWKDKAFKQNLISNPKAVIEKELGVKLPEEVELQLLEETLGVHYILLPWNRESYAIYKEHLSDDDFLVSALSTLPLVEQIAASFCPAGSTETHCFSKCCCGILTISSCF